MGSRKGSLDETDVQILKTLQRDCRTPFGEIADKLGVPKSTVHYRLKRLEREKIIEGYYAKINSAKLGKDYLTVTLVRAKYGPGYHEKVGRKIALVPGVWGVYFIFGENDFIVLARSDNREDYMHKLENIMNMKEIERTNTQVVARILKEDPRIEF